MTKLLAFLVYTAWNLGTPQPGLAQSGGTSEREDAIRCWRQVSENAVHVGQRFTMTVTCRAVETDNARALPDQAVLEPETIEVSPFEVLDGEHYEDIRNGHYRFFQYHYTLRVIDESNFGEDIEIPPLDITYRIERRIGNNPALPGRELTYSLPAEPIRLLSLVPESVVDIRDLPPITFGDAQARLFQAGLLTLSAVLLWIVAVGIVVLGAVRLTREHRKGNDATRGNRRLSLPLIVHRALGELLHVQLITMKDGWKVENARRALAALRVASAVATAKPVTKTQVEPDTPERDGQIHFKHGLLRPKTHVISSSLTTATLIEHLAKARTPRADKVKNSLINDLGQVISVFTAAGYSPDGPLPSDDLTRALDTVIVKLKQLRWRSAAPVRYTTDLLASTNNWWNQAWTR